MEPLLSHDSREVQTFSTRTSNEGVLSLNLSKILWPFVLSSFCSPPDPRPRTPLSVKWRAVAAAGRCGFGGTIRWVGTAQVGGRTAHRRVIYVHTYIYRWVSGILYIDNLHLSYLIKLDYIKKRLVPI